MIWIAGTVVIKRYTCVELTRVSVRLPRLRVDMGRLTKGHLQRCQLG